MNPDVVCARPEMTVAQVAKLLSERRVSGAPVVDDGGRIVGVVSQNDLARYVAERGGVADEGRFFTELDEYRELSRIPADRSRTSVQDVMRPKVFTVARDAGVAMAANILRERGIQRLFVTERGVLVGEITALDLLLVVEELMARLDG
jgi:CBS domain-containing protein